MENKNDRIQMIVIRSMLPKETGNYSLHSMTGNAKGYNDFGGINCDYFYDTTNFGSLNVIQFDSEKNKISAYFDMTLINPDCPKSIMEITQGRFHFNY